MERDKKWYALYTYPRWEKKVAEILTDKDIENYCPLNTVRRRWADRWKIITEPVFRSYVFVRISKTEEIIVKQTNGIVNFVYWDGRPAVIRDEEIEAIKMFLQVHRQVRIETIPGPDDEVQIMNGALNGKQGIVINAGSRRIKIRLPALGYDLVAEVDVENVIVIKEN